VRGPEDAREAARLGAATFARERGGSLSSAYNLARIGASPWVEAWEEAARLHPPGPGPGIILRAMAGKPGERDRLSCLAFVLGVWRRGKRAEKGIE